MSPEPVLDVLSIFTGKTIHLAMQGETVTYKNGGEDDGQDPVGQNPSGRARKSSARQRRKKDNRLFGGTPWAKPKPKPPEEPKK